MKLFGDDYAFMRSDSTCNDNATVFSFNFVCLYSAVFLLHVQWRQKQQRLQKTVKRDWQLKIK